MTTPKNISMLLAAADSGSADMESTINTIGVREVAATLTSEIVFRARLDELTAFGEDASVVVSLKYGDHEIATQISAGTHGVLKGSDALSTLPPTVVAQDMSEVAFALYGPRDRVSASTRELRWPSPNFTVPRLGNTPLPLNFHAIVQRIVRVLDRQEPSDLAELAVRYGTDKWGVMHQYTPHYHRHVEHLRDRRLVILEIGVGGFEDPVRGGGSLKMWKHFFPRATVYGLDIADKRQIDEPRIVTLQADQSDASSLEEIASEVGPFDIVIDDGSHVSSHVIASFKALFPHLRPDGLYVVEDLHGSYWPTLFGGSEDDLSDPEYTAGFLKTLVDGLNHEEFLNPGARPSQPTDSVIRGMHFYHNIAIIEKGANKEGSPIAELLRQVSRP